MKDNKRLRWGFEFIIRNKKIKEVRFVSPKAGVKEWKSG